MIVFWNDSVAIGDVLVSFPGTLQRCLDLKAQHGELALYWTRENVGDLFPHEKYGFPRLPALPAADPPKVIIEKGSVHEMVHYGRRHPTMHEHPTAQFMAHVGYPHLSMACLRPEITYPTDLEVPTYDILISPYILAELPRMWPLSKWQSTINWIEQNYPGISIGILAGTHMPSREDLAKINPYGQDHFYHYAMMMEHSLTGKNVTYVVDKPLTEVAFLMSKAKLVITVDSGPARLMHAVGGKHILLCNNQVGYDWGTYPEARTIYASMAQLEPESLIAEITKAL